MILSECFSPFGNWLRSKGVDVSSASDSTAFSFCESITASGQSRWHIRPLTEVGRKLGGGIDTAALCGFPKPRQSPPGEGEGCGGWDLNVDITDLTHCCPTCADAYRTARNVLRPSD